MTMAERKLLLDSRHFGLASPGTKLTFRVRTGTGFAVRAVLDCDMNFVAKWEWVELSDGGLQEETLIPKGTYTLTLDVVFLAMNPVTVDMDFSVGDETKTISFTANNPDTGRALAIVFIV
jgi:hypothetical protein